jgi:polyisoprenyl-phosphate glycosyltransferase
MNEKIQYSIVVPVYNSENTLDELCYRTVTEMEKISDNYEIFCIDDCSIDQSWKKLQKIREKNKKIKIIHLVRSFGQHNAILCGFYYANGEFVITLDDDLQHPPEEISKLIRKISEGFSVVYGKYEPKNPTIIENIMSTIFQDLIHIILNIPRDIFLSSFAIYKSEIPKKMILIKSTHPFIFGLMIKSTPVEKIANIKVLHFERPRGKSNYGIVKYFKYALNLLINYSSYLLLVVALLGFIISVISFCFGFWIIVQGILTPGYGISGWNSLMIVISFLGGTILLSIGVIGEYLRRILSELSLNPQLSISKMEL